GTFVGIFAGELLSFKESETRLSGYGPLGGCYVVDIDFYHTRNSAKKYCIDSTSVGNFTRFMVCISSPFSTMLPVHDAHKNHSCVPNCAFFPCILNDSDTDKPLLTIFTTTEVHPGEELTLSYCGDTQD
ncbi:SET domain-containing protein, partial [Armillaria gallica]